MSPQPAAAVVTHVERKILLLRGERVMLDPDLAVDLCTGEIVRPPQHRWMMAMRLEAEWKAANQPAACAACRRGAPAPSEHIAA